MAKRATSLQVFAVLVFVLTALTPSPSAQLNGWLSKLEPVLQQRAYLLTGESRIIVRAVDAASLAPVITLIQQLGGSVGRTLLIINGQAAIIPNVSLRSLASSSLVDHVSLDRLIVGAMGRTGPTVGATAVRDAYGYDGSGVGVAVIDSGITSWHDDLTDPSVGTERVDRFVDLVSGQQTPYDDYGHGTHVAGIIAGNGFDSSGVRSGIAPATRLTVLKVLDGSGTGRISDVIAAFGYAITHSGELNIRLVNLSIATGVYESYNVDPLTLAAYQAVRAGIVVVAASGNNGRSQQGHEQYGGITAPGNAPWVLTVGGSSHMGTIDRADDTMAAFSSRGPSAIDYRAKPDIVAPAVGIESLSDPNSAFYVTKSAYLLNGTVPTSYFPYLSLSGTSMATPVVSGTVALMLQANPSLTPNAVKAILQYTAQVYPAYDPLTEGAGFLNTFGAVELARFLAQPPGGVYPSSSAWARQIIWGNRLFAGGRLTADVNAWSTNVTWGSSSASTGEPILWGVICSTANCDTGGGTWIPWGATASSQNVVWGMTCGGADCAGPWSVSRANESGTVVWGTTDGDTVVWGTTDGDTVVWGTDCGDPSCQPVIWP